MRKVKIGISIIMLIIIITGIVIVLRNKLGEDILKLGFPPNSIKNLEEQNMNKSMTTVDVTGIVLGKETQHEHVYKTMYDETKHWKECTVCGIKNNELIHNYKDAGWTGGSSDVCNEENMHILTCECGMKKSNSIGRAEHDYSEYYNDGSLYIGLRRCNNCGVYTDYHKCKMGYKVINCKNLGKCSICGYNYTKVRHTFIADSNGIIKCDLCSGEFGRISENNIERIGDMTVRFKYHIEFNSGSQIIKWAKTENDSWEIEYKDEGYEETENGYTYYEDYELLNKPSVKDSMCWAFYVDSNIGEGTLYIGTIYDYADKEQPIINNIDTSNKTAEEKWDRIKMITISGTENWTNTVNIKIENDKGHVVYEGETNVIDNNWSISCTPDIEADSTGRKFKIIVTDACENSTEQEFTISKIDGIAPEVTSIEKVSEEWAKEKNITFTATDQGIGNVQIAFNDVADYSLASKNGIEYSREYKLTGDVYSPREANVYYKDELGNISTKKVIINKLDNTVPTITRTSFSNNKLNITAHDRHETEGEGSGIEKYRFITSTTKLENPEITVENSTEVLVNENIVISEIYKVKYVYIVAEDAVGNISEVYEEEVPRARINKQSKFKRSKRKRRNRARLVKL